MKKSLSMVLAVTMLLSICLFAGGCGGGSDKVLKMGTNAAFPPYEYKDDNGEYAGIDVEIAGLIAEKLGMELEIYDVDFGVILGGVETGKYDIGMAGMTVTDERLEQVDFSNTYAKAKQVVIVKADSEYASYEDFYTGYKTVDGEDVPAGVKEGITIGVQQDTTGDIYCSSDPEKWGFGKDNVVRYKTGAEAVQALLTGKHTAVIIDSEPAKSFVAANEGLKILDGAFTDEEYAIAVKKGNKELLDKINTALKELTDAGEIDKIVKKYIKE